MGSFGNDTSLHKNDDSIESVKSMESVGDEDGRAIGGDCEQVIGQVVGRLTIKVLGGLIKDNDGSIGQEQPGQGKALTLPSRHAGAEWAQLRVESPGERREPGGEVHAFEGGQHRALVGITTTEPQVVADCGVEDVRLLRQQSDPLTHGITV